MASNMGLYSPEFERDACGIGFVANIKGKGVRMRTGDGPWTPLASVMRCASEMTRAGGSQSCEP